MIRTALRRLWAVPRPPGAPARVWRDWVLVVLVCLGAVLEASLRADVAWRPLALALALALCAGLLWRRTHPMLVSQVTWGAIVAVGVAAWIAGIDGTFGLGAMAFVLVVVYALFRWGSGREIALSLPLVLVAFALGAITDDAPVGETVFGFVFASFPAVVGLVVRLWTSNRRRELDEVRVREREQLARELHDTVAHHVSAMVVRAQAGRVVAATDPAAAGEALEVIEEEGARTLAEMRAMVGALRDPGDTALTPGRGIVDVAQLARTTAPPVDVTLDGDLDALSPAVGAAVYRIAQESVTNALRHARRPSRVLVRVVGDTSGVRVTTSDDGEPGAAGGVGYGLVGMRERAVLLGGTFTAGPSEPRGWVVTAVLPRGRAGEGS